MVGIIQFFSHEEVQVLSESHDRAQVLSGYPYKAQVRNEHHDRAQVWSEYPDRAQVRNGHHGRAQVRSEYPSTILIFYKEQEE